MQQVAEFLVSQIYFSHAALARLSGPGKRRSDVRYNVTHITEYHYGEPVPLCHNLVHLEPRTTAGRRYLSHMLWVTPSPLIRAERADFFGNLATWFSVQEPHQRAANRGEKLGGGEAFDPPVGLWWPGWDESPACWSGAENAIFWMLGNLFSIRRMLRRTVNWRITLGLVFRRAGR